jgi:hypothetical protein
MSYLANELLRLDLGLAFNQLIDKVRETRVASCPDPLCQFRIPYNDPLG